MNSVAPIWDGNETWLVMGGIGAAGGFSPGLRHHHPGGVFPDPVHAARRCCSAALRSSSVTCRPRKHFWDWSFHVGSLIATFAQGIVLGTYVQGIPVEGRHFAGGSFEWATPFAVLTGLALICGYGLLGACWLVMKTEGELQNWARGKARLLAPGRRRIHRDGQRADPADPARKSSTAGSPGPTCCCSRRCR